MEKVFKGLFVCLSILLVVGIIATAIIFPPQMKSGFKLDLFSSATIVENIKNLEMNLTSIIYVKDSKGEWQEYQRLHGNENRIWVGIDKCPENLKNAPEQYAPGLCFYIRPIHHITARAVKVTRVSMVTP